MIDTHCHIDAKIFVQNFEDVLARAKAAGVTKMVLPGVNQAGWDRLLTLCRQEHCLFSAPGLHPIYLANHLPEHREELEAIAEAGNLVAIGEIGLDYFLESIDKTAQQRLFEQQLHIAKFNHLPILLHVRKAHDQVLSTLRRKKFPYGGIVHAFGGSYQQATQYIKLGFGIGIGGTITYERSTKIRKIAATLDRNSLVIETDAPDIPPADHWNQRNLPEYLPEIVDSLAKLRKETVEEVTYYTTVNAIRILGL